MGQAAFPRLGICNTSETLFSETGVGGAAALRAAPPAPGSVLRRSSAVQRVRAAEGAVRPVGRAGTAISQGGLVQATATFDPRIRRP
eukprot:13390517-Alexandrium_andersonii.AAC.1